MKVSVNQITKIHVKLIFFIELQFVNQTIMTY